MTKLVTALLVVGTLVLGAFVIGVPILAANGDRPTASIPHDLLETDRRMTEVMSTTVGPGMDAQMESVGMLERSADPVYVDALEQHTYQFDRTIGRTP